MTNLNNVCEKILYVETGLATKEQIEESFREAVEPLNIVSKFRVNLVEDRNGKNVGFAYVFFSDPRIIDALLGKNLDGTDRIAKKNDPNWNPPTTPLETALAEAESSGSGSGSSDISWADEPCIDDIAKLYECPKIEEKMEPLIQIPSYEYNQEQLDRIREDLNEGEKIPSRGSFDLSRAYSADVYENCHHNILVSLKVPRWITQTHLQNIFDPYVKIRPRINIHDKGSTRMAFIRFSPDTNAATMIFHMTRRITVYDSSDPKKTTSLTFTFAREN